MTLLGLLLGAAAVLLRWAQGRRAAGGRVHQRTVSLGGQQALHVVEVEGRRLLVGTGPGAAPRLLVELVRPPEGMPAPAAREGVGPRLERRGDRGR